MTELVRVLLVDDQELVRVGFRIILESEPGIEVVGEARTGLEALQRASELHPDVICMDVQMPGLDGLAATREIVAGLDSTAATGTDANLAERAVVFGVAATDGVDEAALVLLRHLCAQGGPDVRVAASLSAASAGELTQSAAPAVVLIVAVGAVFAGTRERDTRLVIQLTLFVASAGAALFLIHLLGGNSAPTVGGRYSLSADEYPIELGRDSADGLLVALWAVLCGRSSQARMRALMACPLLAIALIAAGSRGPVLAFVLGLLAVASVVTIFQRVLLVRRQAFAPESSGTAPAGS